VGASNQKLQSSLEILRREVRSCLPNETPSPALQLLHAPVYYGTTVSAYALLNRSADPSEITKAWRIQPASPSQPIDRGLPATSARQEKRRSQLATPQADPSNSGAWWFWAAADNLRLPGGERGKIGGETTPMSRARFLACFLQRTHFVAVAITSPGAPIALPKAHSCDRRSGHRK